jgi:hypothetical protein
LAQICGIADLEFPLRKPVLAKPRYLAVTGYFERIARSTVNPRIANLLRYDRQRVFMRLNGDRNLGEAGGNNLGIGKPSLQVSIGSRKLFRGMRTAVVVAHDNRNSQIRIRHTPDIAVTVVVHHYQ